jgi:hypothetical protein
VEVGEVLLDTSPALEGVREPEEGQAIEGSAIRDHGILVYLAGLAPFTRRRIE